ncbi:DUF6177 family protein [Nocardiopsis baichengensis]|uniref:DUF6177 family protein n=1 Tax=Nocardiopsis baichengensis TaxID=280240 RepID=UPI00126900C1|nr:DUF6177 family protein [Nocardiopsis baichengensis]
MAPTVSDLMDTSPALDLITGKAVVMHQSRQVVPYTQWIADAMHECIAKNLEFQLVTPPTSRVTFPLRYALTNPLFTWVVDDREHGVYDGIRSHALKWLDSSGYVPDVLEGSYLTPAEGFLRPEPRGYPQVQVELVFSSDAGTAKDPELDEVVAFLTGTLTGLPPASWGPTEPMGLHWKKHEDSRERILNLRAPVLFNSSSPMALLIGIAQQKKSRANSRKKLAFIVSAKQENHPLVKIVTPKLLEIKANYGIDSINCYAGTARPDLTFTPRNGQGLTPLC